MDTNDDGKRGILIVFVTILSRVMGLLRTLFISNIYGAGDTADLINYSYALPNQARKGLQEGLGNVDLLSRLHNDKAYAEKCIRSIMGLHFYVGLFLLAISFPLGLILMRISSYPETLRQLGICFFPFYLFSLLFYSLSQSLNAVLQDQGHYRRGQVHPLVYSAIVLAGIAFYGRKHVFAFPVSLLIGSIVYFIITVIALLRLGMRIGIDFRIERNLRVSYIRGNYMVVLYMLMNMVYYISSSQSASGATCFTLAHTLVLIPYSMILMLFTGLYYPRMATSNRVGKQILILDRAIETLSALIIPAAILLYTFSKEISVFLFEGGAFTRENALVVAELIDMMAPGMIFMLLFGMLERMAFLENRERRVYVTLTVVTVVISVILLTIGREDVRIPAFLFTVSNILTSLILLFTTGTVNGKRMLKSLVKALVVSAPIIVLSIIWKTKAIFMFNTLDSKLLVMLACLGIGMLAMVSSYVIWFFMHQREAR